MSVKVENLDKNMAKITVEVDASELDKAIKSAYNRQKKSMSIPGFRKGKVPQAVIERMYGAQVFYDDAANILISQEYPKAYDESGLDIVSQPQVEVVKCEKGENFIFTAEVATRPEVKLGKYEGVTVTKIDTTVTDEEVEEEIARQLKSNARTVTVDRAIENGDTAVIDFDGSVDGVAFDGGKSENYSLEIGSHSFIDTFEDQLVGKKAGDDVDVNVTFPEDYQEASLAGKAALFKVKIHEVKSKELPTLDDEYVQDTTEFENVADYKADVKATLEKRKEDNAKRTKEDEALAKIVDKSSMEIPDAMLDTQVNNMINDYARNLAQSGLSFQQYLQFTGMTIEQFREQSRPDALQRVKTSLVLEAIVKEQNLEATDADVDARIEEMSKQYNMPAEDLKKNIQDDELEGFKKQIAIEKAIDFVMDNVKERAKRKSKKDEEKED
ncbi:MAG: trigger factor [Lachnospiraceae bacterium]|nr:trigger factor [Lachnospiraceae bacterium]MCR4732249.1 trigger factor [Lachnospiraceae bacterium]MEE3356244.1 trigger factor [Candidatus Weimeria sp.]